MDKVKPSLYVEFYKEENGNEPVRSWLKKLNKAIKLIIGEDISRVQYRWPLGMPLVRPLGHGLYQLRITIPNGIIRIIFIVINKKMVLFHGLVKKTEKLPSRDLEIAKERGKKYEDKEKEA
jgi:phage-related protein